MVSVFVLIIKNNLNSISSTLDKMTKVQHKIVMEWNYNLLKNNGINNTELTGLGGAGGGRLQGASGW